MKDNQIVTTEGGVEYHNRTEMAVSFINNSRYDMPFADCFNEYLETINDGSRTFGSKIEMSKHIIKGLGSYRMCDINKAAIRKFLNKFSNQTYSRTNGKKTSYYSQSTINKVFDLLHGFIVDASDEDGERLLKTDFMAKLKKPRSRKHLSEKEHVYSDAEIKQVMHALSIEPMSLCWIHLLADTGIRPSEALALKFSDINYEESTIRIFRTISKAADYDVKTKKRIGSYKIFIKDLKNETAHHKKNYQRRILTISNGTLNILSNWEKSIRGNAQLMTKKREHGTEEYLFCGSKGQFWSYDHHKQLYERTLSKSGLDAKSMNPYRYRHTVCTDLLRSGVDIKTVQLILGDNTPDMVLRVYANMNKEDVIKGSQVRANRMDILLGEKA